jgi:DNA-binding MltR family transcriptional regulator
MEPYAQAWLLVSPADKEILTQLADANDRAVALVLGGYLDEFIREVIRKRSVADEDFFKKFTRGYAPLSSFSAKIDFLYLTKIIGAETRRDMVTIKNIRNEFAHQPRPLSFQDQSIRDLCANLRLNDRLDSLDHEMVKVIKTILRVPAEIDFSAPRMRFIRTVQILTTLLASPGSAPNRHDGPFF